MLIYRSQPRMDTPSKDLEVVCIPIKGSPMRPEKVPLVKVGPGGISKDECKEFEKELGHLPDLRAYEKFRHFSWTYRSLVGILAKNLPGEWGGTWKRDYMLYLCVDERAGLPRNEYLEEVLDDSSGERGTRPAPIVYGDAFVFKKEPKLQGPDVSERAEYAHMDQDLVDSVRYNGFRAQAVLERLLRVSTEGDDI